MSTETHSNTPRYVGDTTRAEGDTNWLTNRFIHKLTQKLYEQNMTQVKQYRLMGRHTHTHTHTHTHKMEAVISPDVVSLFVRGVVLHD